MSVSFMQRGMMTRSLFTVLWHTAVVCLKVGQFCPPSRLREKGSILLHGFRGPQSRKTNPHVHVGS
jgi:hypothetical protein